MVEDFKKLKKVIEKAQDITLLPSPDFRKDSFPATLALFYSLKKLGKNVNLAAENYPQKYGFLVKKEKFHVPEANFLISIKEIGIKLSQLFYEKTENGLKLYLKTNGGELKKENVALQPLGSGELLITLGIESFQRVKEVLKEKPNSMINIDNQLENENYGDINLIELRTPSLSEIVFDVLSSIDEKLFGKETSNCLLCGIIQGTSNFQDPKLDSRAFQKASFLIEKGANLREITSSLYGIEKGSSLRIFGRVLSKLNLSEEQNLGWVLLEKEDFVATASSSVNLRFALSKLSSGLFPFQNFLCLWQGENSPAITRGVFHSQNKKMTEKIRDHFGGLQKGDGVLFQTEEIDPQKVKDKVLEILS